MDHEQIEVLKCFDYQLGVGERHDRVVCLNDERLDGIRVARNHLAEHQWRVGVGIERWVGLGDDVPALEGQAGEDIVSNHLVALLLGQGVVLKERRWEARRRSKLISAFLV